MKYYWQNSAWTVFFCLLLGACNNPSEETKLPPPSTPLSKVSSPALPVITQEFATFLKQFPQEAGAKAYDTDWLNDFREGDAVKEISPKDCERYIYGKSIVLENQGQKTLLASNSYYYVGRLPDNGQYIAIVFTDLSDGDISTYLCTYQRDGKFISGIVLQRLNNQLPEKYNVNHSVEVKKVPEKSIQIINDYTHTGYQIDSMGKIQAFASQTSS